MSMLYSLVTLLSNKKRNPTMLASPETKRQNFNVTPDQEAEILSLQTAFSAVSAKDAILKAVHLSLVLAREIKGGKRLGLIDSRSGGVTEIILPELESVHAKAWTYLVERPDSWKRQLFVKGRKLTAAQVWQDMTANNLSGVDAAENWGLPIAVIEEIDAYCTANAALLQMEADEERLVLQTHGVPVAP